MASRNRSCQHLEPRSVASMPQPESLAPLAPLTAILMDAAQEYDSVSIGGELTTAVEFVRWLDVEVQKSAHFRGQSWVNTIPTKVGRRVDHGEVPDR